MPKALADALLTNSGGLVLSFLAHFPKHRLVRDATLYSSLRDIVDGDPFAGTFWPLTLELTHLGESDPSWNKRVTPGALRTLHDAKISIVDWEAPPKVFLDQSGDDEDDDSGPDYAIEDHGSDYREEDSSEADEDAPVPFLGRREIDLDELL